MYKDNQNTASLSAPAQRTSNQERQLLDIAGVMLVVLNPQGDIELINKKGCAMLGYREEEVIGRNWFDLCITKDKLGSVKTVFAQLIAGEKWPEYHENPIITKAGQERIFAFHNAVLRDESSRVTGVLFSGEDITDYQLNRLALQRSEERFRRIFEEGPLGMAVVSSDFHFMKINAALCRILGYPEEELNYRKFSDIIASGHVRDHVEQFEKMYRGEIAQYQDLKRYIRKDGKMIWGQITVFPVHKVKGEFHYFMVFIEDITERKKSEEALLESEAFNSTVLNNSPNPIYVISEDTTLRYVNTSFENLTGFSGEEVIGRKVPYPWWPADEQIMAHFREDVQQGFSQSERSLTRKNGERFWVETNFKTIRLKDEQKYYLVSWVDITEKRKTSLALEESERRYRSLVNNIQLGIFRSTPDDQGRYLEVNNAMEMLTGYSRQELLKIPVISLYTNPAERKTVLSSAATARGKTTREMLLKKKDGSEIPVAVTISPVRDDQGNILFFDGIMEDITERKQAEARALETESLKQLNKAKSELLANVSHELRTPLASIKGYIETLIEPDVQWSKEKQLDFLQCANEETDRLTFLIRDLLDMSKLDSGKMVLVKRAYSVREIIDSLKSVLNRITKDHVLKIQIAPRLPAVEADKMKISQVITNLVENAAKFSPEGSLIRLAAKADDGNLIVSVTDKGEGISAEATSNLFNRFYQVYQVVSGKTRGTGLGLAICKGIVEAHGGNIRVKSKEGAGSTFTFSIPFKSESPSASNNSDGTI